MGGKGSNFPPRKYHRKDIKNETLRVIHRISGVDLRPHDIANISQNPRKKYSVVIRHV